MMGKSIFRKIVLIFSSVLLVNFISIYFLTKSVKLEASKINVNITNIVSLDQISSQENVILNKKYSTVATKIQEYMDKKRIENNITSNELNKTEVPSITLPKLAIIMDDIAFYRHADSIKKVPFPITPAIFPPTKLFPHTKDIAEDLGYYMVHFPMEAENYSNVIENAIKVSDSKEQLKKRIDNVMQNFPDAVAINNHTGSKFTCNYDSMSDFFSILQKYNIAFIDSKTTAQTQCISAGKKFDKKVMQRDIFLDNKRDISYIKGQLEEAVRIAKEYGQAIAICHPKEETFAALMDCEDIIKGVKLVYISELL